MLQKIFLSILNMSLAASAIILIVLIARCFVKKLPKAFSYAMWAAVLFRLLCPFSFESIVSLMPINPKPISDKIALAPSVQLDTGINALDNIVVFNQSNAVVNSVNPMQIFIFAASIIWILGTAALIAYSVISLIRLKASLKNSKKIESSIYACTNISTAFVLGVINPKIYVPSGLSQTELEFILLHEQTHIKRFDHVIKLISFFVLCLHWFNPLVWVSFFLSGRDMEMACDEAVIKRLGSGIKKDYSSSLLRLATGKKIIGGTPLAFGEGDTCCRIKNVLKYKSLKVWISAVCVIAVLVLAVMLIANPVSTVKMENSGILPKDFAIKALSTEITYLDNIKSVDTVSDEMADVRYFLSQMKISKREIADLREEERNFKNKIVLYYDDERAIANTFYFSDDFSEMYVDNGVKPGFLYAVKEPQKAHRFFIEKTGFALTGEMPSAEKLVNMAAKYVGSSSEVGKIINALPYPDNVSYDSFELITDKEPYGVIINYKTDAQTFKSYDVSNSSKGDVFRKNTLIVLALIENAEYVKHNLSDGSLSVTFMNTREWAEDVVGKDIRLYSKSAEDMQQLLNLSFAGNVQSEIKETIINSSIDRIGQANIVNFPVYIDERTQQNSKIFDIEPFSVRIALPSGFYLGAEDKAYLPLGAWSKVGIYNSQNEYVGAMGYNIYEQVQGAEDVPQAIYSQIALGNGYRFDAQTAENKGAYTEMNKADGTVSAVTEVYYSPQLAKESGYGNEEHVNKGILAYNKSLKVYIAVELDSEKIRDAQLKQIARGIVISNNQGTIALRKNEPKLAGFYQSAMINGEVVQISIDSVKGTFVEYISSRAVNKGTFTRLGNGTYNFVGDELSFNIYVEDDDSFTVDLKKINPEPIKLNQLNTDKNVVVTIGQEYYTDVEQYKELLK